MVFLLKVKENFLVVILLLFLITSGQSGFAQQISEQYLLTSDIETLLPPLNKILDSALAINPNIRFRDLQIDMSKASKKTGKLEWIRNIGIQTDARYGTFDNFSSNLASSTSSSTMIATRNNQLNYGIGASVRFPIYEYLNRKNQAANSQGLIDQAIAMAESQRIELRQAIIKQYNDLILKQRLLKLRSKYIETARMNLVMLEKQFQNGQITLDEYSRISETVTRTETEYETAKIDLLTSYMIFEEVTGIRFNLKNNLNFAK